MKRLWSAILASVMLTSPSWAQQPMPISRPVPDPGTPPGMVMQQQSNGPVANAPGNAANAPAWVNNGPSCANGNCNNSNNAGCNTGNCDNQRGAPSFNLWNLNPWGGCSSCDRGGCGGCGPNGRVWGQIDYILWSSSGDHLPPLVTTNGATAPIAGGVLPNATVLFGGDSNANYRSGIRYLFGGWLNCESTIGIQFGGFFLEDGSNRGTFASAGTPILARPFTNPAGNPGSQLVAFPGVVSGNIAIDNPSSVEGFDLALRGNMCCSPCSRIDALIGYRYLRVADRLTIQENLVAGPQAQATLGVPTGTTIGVTDQFTATNTFNGVELGFTGEYRFLGSLFLEGTGKASFGYIGQQSSINGATLINGTPATPGTGGLLALSSNIGSRNRSQATIVPEFNLNLGYQVTDNIRLRLGYSFLYIHSLFRVGNQVDTTVNTALFPGAGFNGAGVQRPGFPGSITDYSLQGFNLGVEFRF